MCEFDTESRKLQKQEMSERQKEMTYWGWKFEQYVTAGAYSISHLLTFAIFLCQMIKYKTCVKRSHFTIYVFQVKPFFFPHMHVLQVHVYIR